MMKWFDERRVRRAYSVYFMFMTEKKTEKIKRRHTRIRARISGTAKRPRLCVFKSNNNISAQLVDDDSGKVIAGVISSKVAPKKKGMEQAIEAGKAIAKLAEENNIKNVVFDRGGFIYTGKVKALADAAREGGLVF